MFGLKSKLQKRVEAAAAVTARAAKIESAIAAEVDTLPAKIETRLERERDFRTLECAAAIGEPSLGLDKARKSSAETKAALDESSLRLAGFRRARGDLGTDLVSAYEGISTELADHEAGIVDAFARDEWLPAVAAFNVVLGRRAAIEKFLGGDKIELPEPVPADVSTAELGEIGKPYAHLEQLTTCIDKIRAMGTAADAPANARMYATAGSVTHYDPNGVFTLTDAKGFLDVPQGAKFVDATFDRGWSEYLVLSGSAKPVGEVEAEGVTTAARKLTTLARDAQTRQQDQDAQRFSAKGVVPRTRKPNFDTKP